MAIFSYKHIALASNAESIPLCLDQPLKPGMALSWRQILRYSRGLDQWQTFIESNYRPTPKTMGMLSIAMIFAAMLIFNFDVVLAYGLALLMASDKIVHSRLRWMHAQRYLEQIDARRAELREHYDPSIQRGRASLDGWKPAWHESPGLKRSRRILALAQLPLIVLLFLNPMGLQPGYPQAIDVVKGVMVFIAIHMVLRNYLYWKRRQSPIVDTQEKISGV